jgi:hypothetical protein
MLQRQQLPSTGKPVSFTPPPVLVARPVPHGIIMGISYLRLGYENVGK